MKRILPGILFILGITALFLALNMLLQTDGYTRYGEENFITFENALYSPDEIIEIENSGSDKLETVTDNVHSYWEEDEFSRVRTSYIDIELEEGKVYGIYGENLTYAFNLYVNGELIASSGKVGTSAENSEPLTRGFTAYFTAQAKNRIVVQRCNFVHAKWNSFYVYLGEQDIISRYQKSEYFMYANTVTILLVMCLVNLGLFVGLKKQKRFLLFSLACLALMINYMFSGPKTIMLLFPNLNWFFGHKLETCSLVLTALFLILFFEECFGKLQKPIRIIGYILIGLSVAYYAILPSTIYTKYSVFVADFVIGYALIMVAIIIVRTMKNFKKVNISQKYYLVSISLILVAAVRGALHLEMYLDFLKISLVLSDIILTMGLAYEYRQTKENLEAAERNEELLKQMNEDLDRTRKLQNNFLAIMNHEMRTPLTVIAGYADMIKMKAQMAGSTDEDAIKNLGFIKDEAMRLGRIVEKSEEGIVDYIGYGEKKKVNVSELFEDVSKFCTPICEKRHVTIRTESPDGISVNCYKDEMLQVLYNLVLNASRHSENGEIVLRARQEEEDVLIHVSDNGDGMDDETMKHAFDKGYTKDGGHGIGLALCKDIVLAHNGTIHIEKNTDKGITVCILLLDK